MKGRDTMKCIGRIIIDEYCCCTICEFVAIKKKNIYLNDFIQRDGTETAGTEKAVAVEKS